MPKQRPPTPATKTELIRQTLYRKSGTSLSDLCKVTGWQPHSVRAALSRFRKAGDTIDRMPARKDGAGPVYRIKHTQEAK